MGVVRRLCRIALSVHHRVRGGYGSERRIRSARISASYVRAQPHLRAQHQGTVYLVNEREVERYQGRI